MLYRALFLSLLSTSARGSMVDIERNLFELDKLLQNDGGDETCHQLLDQFSLHASQFVLCSNKYAKPISMCRQCAPFLIDLTISYQALSNHSEGGLLCKDILTSQDRVEIIQETYRYIAANPSKADTYQGLWNKGHCNNCYKEPLTHGSELTEETVNFFSRHAVVMDCFDKYPYEDTSGPRNSSEACHACQVYYQNLSDYYKTSLLGPDAPFTSTVCFDIVDAMNQTQQQWGEKYNCGRRAEHKDHIGLLVAVSVVLSTPLFFYSIVRLSGTSAEERVINQRHITDFFDQNLRRLSFNRSRFSRSSRTSGDSPDAAQTTPGTDNPGVGDNHTGVGDNHIGVGDNRGLNPDNISTASR